MKISQNILFTLLCTVFCFQVAAENWPPQPFADQGMVWYWISQEEAAFVASGDGDWVRDAEVRFRYGARPNWFTGVDVREGALEAFEIGEVLGELIRETGNLIVEIGLQPDRRGPDGILFQWATPENVFLRVWVEDGRLWVISGGRDPVSLEAFDLEGPAYIGFEFLQERVIWSVNGEQRHAADWGGLQLPGDEEATGNAVFLFGSDFDGAQSWRGDMDHLAIRVEPGNLPAAAAAWQQSVAGRDTPPVLTKDAVLHQASGLPDPEDLMDYDESIIALIWEIVDEESDLKGEQILTWHWYQLDREVLKNGAPPPVGTRTTLEISPAETQPQVQGVQMIHIGLDPDEFILMPEFLLLSSPAGGQED